MKLPSTRAVLRYGLITRSGRTVTDADRKCFVATAAAPAPQNGGTRCVFGVPPARQILQVRLRPTPFCCSLNPTPLRYFCRAYGLPNVSRPHSKLCTRSSFLGAQNFRTKYVVMKQFIDCLGENYEISKSARTDTQLPKDSRGSVGLAASEQLLFRNVRPTFVMKRSCAGAYA